MNAKTIITIVIIAAMFFVLIIFSSLYVASFGFIKYSIISDALLTGNLEEITEQDEKDFYTRVIAVKDEIEEEKQVSINVALFVATFIVVENENPNFSYDIMTTDKIKALLNSYYEKKITLQCSTIVSEENVDTENDNEEVSNISINCASDIDCSCPEGYKELSSDTKYVVNIDKYKQYLKNSFFIDVMPDDYFSNDSNTKAKEIDDLVQLVMDQYDDLISQIQETDLSFFAPPLDIGGCVVTSPFGERIDPISNKLTVHKGIDIVNAPQIIYAAGDGIVAATRTDVLGQDTTKGYGNVVFINHQINGMIYETVYAHLAPGSIKVKPGDAVIKGATIAHMGTTGYSTGVHLHFEVRVEGSQVDPGTLFVGRCFGNIFRY